MTMKAVVYERYGHPEVLEFQEIDRPAVSDRDVLIRVRASCVNAADWHFLTGTPWMLRLTAGLLKPKRRVLGLDVAGTVEEVGQSVSRMQPGDEVFATTDDMGGFAEYFRVSEDGTVLIPANVTHKEAAAVPVAALTALQGLRGQGRIQAGQKVLINGAAGGVGTFAVQIVKSFGAEVAGGCLPRTGYMSLPLVRRFACCGSGSQGAAGWFRACHGPNSEICSLSRDCWKPGR
jgi:NADPH:quinone reductase-like Zn-dependent oxidoreductase